MRKINYNHDLPIVAVIALALALAALILALVGCAGAPAHVTKAQCKTQYTTWQTGPARMPASLMADRLTDMDFVGAASYARMLKDTPMPACADPNKYWTKLLDRIIAMGDNSGIGLGYIMAQAGEVKNLEDKITVELKQNAGVTT